MDAATEAPQKSAELTYWFAGDVTDGPSWDAGHLARVRGLVGKPPPDELDPEKWLAGYYSTPTDYDASPPMPDEEIRPRDLDESLRRIGSSESVAGHDESRAGPEGGLPQPVIPGWAKDIHPRSLTAPRFVTEDLEAEQVLEVWRHDGLLTVVGKPSFESDGAAAVMVHLLEGVVSYVEGWGRVRPREASRRVVVEGLWSRALQNHFKRVQAAVEDRSPTATAHSAREAAPVPPVPNWADELHPRSLIAPAYVLGDHQAEQVLEVWRHKGLLTIVGKPRFEINSDAAFMVHQLDTQIRFMDSLRNDGPRDASCPTLAIAGWASERDCSE